MFAENRAVVGMAMVGLMLLLTGCGASKAALGHFVAEEAINVSHVAGTRWVPRSIPPAELAAVPAAAIEAQAQRLSARVADLEFDDAVEVVVNACEMAELMKATGSETAAVTYLRDKGKSGWVYAQRAKDMAKELADTKKSGTDRAVTLGGAALCEAASQQRK